MHLRQHGFFFQFKVTGNNLLSACKLVFKISRNEKNDPEFLKGDILGIFNSLLSCIIFNCYFL